MGKRADHLVFPDESSVNIDLTRRYGRAIGKTRVRGHAPLSTPRAQTVLGSVRLNGQTTHTTYTGGTTGQRFWEYLKDILIPTLHKGDIVVTDNMRSHHVKEVAETLHAAGIELWYLPPYSSDMNPIEMLWSKVKALLRKWKCRTAELLPKTVSCALLCVNQRDCIGWFMPMDIACNFGNCYKTKFHICGSSAILQLLYFIQWAFSPASNMLL